jgi:hypothetical protein
MSCFYILNVKSARLPNYILSSQGLGSIHFRYIGGGGGGGSSTRTAAARRDQLRCENEFRVVDKRNSEILNGKISQTIGDRTNTVGFGLQSAAKVTNII